LEPVSKDKGDVVHRGRDRPKLASPLTLKALIVLVVVGLYVVALSAASGPELSLLVGKVDSEFAAGTFGKPADWLKASM
jgi:hypothetical protein